MKRLSCLVLVVFVLLCGNVSFGKNYWYESLAPGTSAAIVGTTTFALAAYDKYAGTDVYGAIVATYHVENFHVRVRYDGTAPTLTEGFLLYPGDVLKLSEVEDIRQFKVIGVGGTSTIKVGYEEDNK